MQVYKSLLVLLGRPGSEAGRRETWRAGPRLRGQLLLISSHLRSSGNAGPEDLLDLTFLIEAKILGFIFLV